MEPRIVRADVGSEGDGVRLGRRGLLMGLGAAALAGACGSAEGGGALGESFEAVPKAASLQWTTKDAANFSSVPSWTWEKILSFFNMVRDARWLGMTGSPGFARRIPWLYPDGGCEERAEVMVWLGRALMGSSEPYKIFARGMMCIDSENAPKPVCWATHVAAVVRSSGTGNPLVIDPSIDPTSPMHWLRWFKTIGASQVAFHDGSVYAGQPTANGGINYALETIRNTLLRLEWDRQILLGRDPYRVLGDDPPW